MNRLVAEDLIPAEAEETLYLFNDVRNRIVHGHRSVRLANSYEPPNRLTAQFIRRLTEQKPALWAASVRHLQMDRDDGYNIRVATFMGPLDDHNRGLRPRTRSIVVDPREG